MSNSHDVIVAGLGSMGSAACYHLARAGAQVLGLDSQNIPNNNSSYNGNTRVIRLSYQEHPDYVPLLRRAYRLWYELEQETSACLFHKTGILYMGFPGGEAIKGVRLASKKHNLEITELSHDDLRKTHPQFRLPEGMVGVFENQAGYLMSERAVLAYADAAIKNGAQLKSNEAVLKWTADNKGVTVKTHLGVHHAKKLILTAGAWSGGLLRLPKLDLAVTRQVLGWVWPRRPEQFRRGEFPVWNIDPVGDENMVGIYYGFPLSTDTAEGIGLKLARHFPGEPMHPDQITHETNEKDRDEILLPLRRYIPNGVGDLMALETCKYTNSADGHFIIDRHPENENVLIACGFSGHGFKFSSAVGSILAELATEGKSSSPIGFLGLSRFG